MTVPLAGLCEVAVLAVSFLEKRGNVAKAKLDAADAADKAAEQARLPSNPV